MKTKTTFFTCVLAMLFLFGTMIVNAQVSEVWNQTHEWNADYHYRGIAYNSNNNHLYVAGAPYDGAANSGDPAQNKIQILDSFTGDVLKVLTLEPLTLSGNGYGIKDVEVDDAGGIFATMTTTNKWHPIKIYYWANEDADPVVLWTDAGGVSIPHGPGFSVSGDYANGDALIILPQYTIGSVYYLESSNGVLGDVKTLVLTGVAGGKNVSIQALGNRIADGFWYNNSALKEPTLFDGTGSIIGAIDGALFTGDIGGAKQFKAGAKDYLTVSNMGKIQIIDITDAAADFSNVDASNFIQEIDGTDPSPEWGTPYGYGQEEVIVTFASGGYEIFSLSGDNYIKALVTEEAPYATDLLLTGFAMPGEQTQVSYTYIDVNGDLEGTSLYEWFIDDGAKGKTSVGTGDTYDVQPSDVGKDLTFTVLPKALTGTTDGILVESSSVAVSLSSTAPEAQDIAMTGAPEVYGLITGSYTYYDFESDAEGESVIKWWRADDATGLNAVEIATDTLMYEPQPIDEDKFIIFSVTPVAQVEPTIGDSVAVVSAVVVFPVFLPVASNVAISGIEEVSRVITGSYTYSDFNEDVEGASVLTWYSADAADGAKTAVATDTNMYELLAADEGKIIFFGVKPITVDAQEGIEVFDTTGVIAPKPDESAPIASDVMVNGIPEVGAILSGGYTYSDYTDDPEGATKFKWYAADDVAGTNATVIEGADNQTLLVEDAQVGKFIIFEVTPVASSGGLLEGLPVTDTTLTATVVSSQTEGIERMWLASTKSGAAPFYLNPAVTTERGFAIGEDHIYIASRNNGVKVFMVNKEDGSYLGELNTEGIEGGIYAINDIEVSDDGQILAAPLIDDGTFKIYKWENELATPEKWLEVELPAKWRMGDKFSVTGDLTGDAIIMAVAAADTNQIVRWVITGGIPAEADYISMEKGMLGTSSPAAVPFSASPDANILVDAKGLAPIVLDKDGKLIGSIARIDDYGAYKIQSNSPNVFVYKGRTMAAFFQAMRQEPLGARIIIADITSQPYQIVDSTEYISNSMAWDGYLGEVDITVDEEYYHAYMLQAKNALARYRGKLEFPQFVSAQTNFDGDMIYADFDMALNDTTVAVDSVWTIMAGDTKLEIDSIFSVEAKMTFELATAITEGQVVTLTYDGMGEVVSFNGMPLGAFGPEAVLNIVGADVPVATDVAISGTTETGEVVTGTYTFTDPDGDLEGESTYQWYYATDAEGTDLLRIIGGTSIDYTIAADMKDKFIAFEVTPVSLTGGADYLVGEPAMSAFSLVKAVGVNEAFASRVNVYPNPVKDVLTIDNCSDVYSLTILDYTGRVVNAFVNNGDSQFTIDMSSLNSGVYLIQLNGNDTQSRVKRVVKN